MPPPGSGDLTVVSTDDSDASGFTLSGWVPKVGVHIQGDEQARPPLALVYLGFTMVMGAMSAWFVFDQWLLPESWMPIVVLGILAFGVQYFQVVVSQANISLGVGFLIAACLMAGPPAGALVVAIVMGLGALSREFLPWFSATRGHDLSVRVFRPLYTAVSGCLVYGLSSLIAFEVFSLTAPVTDVTLETMGASILFTGLVYLLNNVSSLLLNAIAGEDVMGHLKTVIPVPALVEFLALPAALLLVVTQVRLGVAAFALLAWLYLMAAYLAWRSSEDRRQLAMRLKDVDMLRRVGASFVETIEMGELVIRFRDAIQDLVVFEQMIILLSDTTEGISQTFAFDRFGARGELTHRLLEETESLDLGFNPDNIGAVYVGDFGAGEAATLRLRLDFLSLMIPSERKLTLLETLCQQGGTALSNGYLFRLANTDPLTNVASRRYFERALRAVADRENIFAVIMLDLDRFKSINDEYGHPVGDSVLRDLAEVLRGSLRAMDIAGRYGGEEFVILLPGAASPEATAVAERIRRTLEQRRIRAGEHEIKYTSSFGVADSTGLITEENSMKIVWRADEALLMAKRSGRNQVITYASLAR